VDVTYAYQGRGGSSRRKKDESFLSPSRGERRALFNGRKVEGELAVFGLKRRRR